MLPKYLLHVCSKALSHHRDSSNTNKPLGCKHLAQAMPTVFRSYTLMAQTMSVSKHHSRQRFDSCLWSITRLKLFLTSKGQQFSLCLPLSIYLSITGGHLVYRISAYSSCIYHILHNSPTLLFGNLKKMTLSSLCILALKFQHYWIKSPPSQTFVSYGHHKGCTGPSWDWITSTTSTQVFKPRDTTPLWSWWQSPARLSNLPSLYFSVDPGRINPWPGS